MPRKTMVHLYYRNSADARKDCEFLGIDKRRVINLGRYGQFQTTDWDTDEPVTVTAKLKISEDHLRKFPQKVLDKLNHIDDETTW